MGNKVNTLKEQNVVFNKFSTIVSNRRKINKCDLKKKTLFLLKGGPFDYSHRAPKIIATPLFTRFRVKSLPMNEYKSKDTFSLIRTGVLITKINKTVEMSNMNKITLENGENTRFKSLIRALNLPSHRGYLILC